jgi:hypothetical protein
MSHLLPKKYFFSYYLNESHVSISSTYTDKKENLIFLIYKEMQNGAVAKSYMTNGLLIHRGNICAFPHILGSPSSYTV